MRIVTHYLRVVNILLPSKKVSIETKNSSAWYSYPFRRQRGVGKLVLMQLDHQSLAQRLTRRRCGNYMTPYGNFTVRHILGLKPRVKTPMRIDFREPLVSVFWWSKHSWYCIALIPNASILSIHEAQLVDHSTNFCTIHPARASEPPSSPLVCIFFFAEFWRDMYTTPHNSERDTFSRLKAKLTFEIGKWHRNIRFAKGTVSIFP